MHGSIDFETPQPRMSIIELPGSDIQREGVLKKLKTNKKKYFVLRSTSSSGPARLEYYDSEKKLRMGHPPKRSIKLHTCFNINKKNDTRQKYAIALYTKDECFSVVADDDVEQELWLNLLLKLQNEFIPPGEMPKPHYDHVWQVTVKPKGLGISRAICGDYRLGLSETEICMIKKNSDSPEFTFQLSHIRKCGNTDNFFFMDLGRQAPTGPGEMFMQLEDSFCAQNIHEQMLLYMRKSTTSGDFRQRSSTSSSTLRRPRDKAETENDIALARQRTCSEGKKNTNPNSRRSYPSRPQSVANLASGSKSPGVENNLHSQLGSFSGLYANIPSSFVMARERSNSSSSKASSHKSLTMDGDDFSSEPFSISSFRSMTPDSIPITEESLSSYMDMSPGQSSTATNEGSVYLDMSPGQHSSSGQRVTSPRQQTSPGQHPLSPGQYTIKPIAFNTVQHGRSASMPVTTQNSTSDNPYLAMSPGQSTPDSTASSYIAMSPGKQHSISMTTLQNPHGTSQSGTLSPGQHSMPYSPPSQRVIRPETPPNQRVSRPGSSCSHDSSANSSEGYMEMNPTEKSKSTEKVNIGPEHGYIDMTVGSSSSTSSKDGSPKLSRTAPIPIRPTKQSGYLEMGPSSQPLAPVKEGGSGEGYLPMTPQNNPFGDVELRPHKVVSYLSDDSMSGEFPKRAYSVGSRPPRKLIPQHVHHAVNMNKQNVSTNGRSSSAPHLIEKKLRSMIPHSQADSSLSCSPSQSIKSSISDSDSFIEMESMRPRTSSDSFGCRPRSSSFGRGYIPGFQGHRPRSSSYGTSARGKLGSYESVRLTSKELHLKHSNESLTGQLSGASSSESLKRNDTNPKINKKSEYVDMKLDKSESPGYIDMTCNPKSVGNRSTSSLASISSSHGAPQGSPVIHGLTSPNRQDATSSPSIKIIKPSGTPKSFGFNTSMNSSTDSIPPSSSLFSPINFVSPSGSRSPSVKGRSPAGSGRESEEEGYLPYQPGSMEKTEKKVENLTKPDKKEKKSLLSKSKHKKHSDDKKHTQKTIEKSKMSDPGLENLAHGSYMQQIKDDRDSMYMDFEPGTLDLSNQSTQSAVFSGFTSPQEQGYVPLSPVIDQFAVQSPSQLTQRLEEAVVKQNICQVSDASSYVEYEPEKSSVKFGLSDEPEVSEESGYMQYEPGTVNLPKENPVPLSAEDRQPVVPPRKLDPQSAKKDIKVEQESGDSSVETLKDDDSASHVNIDPYMDFDPDSESNDASNIKTPSRVRSFITDSSTCMEEALTKDATNSNTPSNNSNTPAKNSAVDKPCPNKELNESSSSDNVDSSKNKIQTKTSVNNSKNNKKTSAADDDDEYVGLDFKSSERFLFGENTPSSKVSHEQLISPRNSIIEKMAVEETKQVKTENIEVKEKLPPTPSKKIRDVFNSLSSVEELKIDEKSSAKEERNRKTSVSTKVSSPKELTKQGSLPCMNLPAEILELQIKEMNDTVSYERENSQTSQTSRHSCSDLTVSYEPMNFPSDTIKSSSELSGSQQITTPGLNYADLDLGSGDNIDSEVKITPVKSRHASIADDSGPLPPSSYAEIDFKMSENLKNTGKPDIK